MKILLSQIGLILVMVSLIGMVAHALKKWVTGEIEGSFVSWYTTHPRASVGALMGCLGGVLTAVLTGTLMDLSDASIMAAFLTGFSADTFNNQGAKK
jgi:hypothetical protein